MTVLPAALGPASTAPDIILTREYVKGPMARAVPGAYFDGDAKAWVLGDPSPRAAVVALKLFPGLEREYPELADLRAEALQNARPLDYPTTLGLRASAPRVRAAIAERGWDFHDYQELDVGYGLAWMREHNGYVLGWDRGLGKTIGTCMFMDDLGTGSNLIVAPNKAKSVTWADELAELCPWLQVLVLPNDKPKRERMLRQVKALHDAGEDFALVVHYEALAVIAGKAGKTNGGRVKLGDGWKKLGIVWELFAADEGHRFANAASLQSRAAGKVPAMRRLLLSGSIYQNAWEEVYGLLHWTYPKTYTSRWRDWNDRFLDYVDNGYGKICVGILPHRIDEMRDELGRMMAYRTKTPLAQKHTVTVELSAEQRRVYDQVQTECLASLADGTTVKAASGIAMLGKLRQVATGLDLLSDEVVDSTKLDAAEDVIEGGLQLGDDFVVFTWYKASAYALERRLAAKGIESWTLTGDTGKTEGDDAVRRFQAGERRVFIGTIATMGESLNLQRANHVLRLDRAWNPALNQQAVDRVDRQGNPRPDDIHLTDIIAADTVDELNVMPNLANKQALAAAILGEI